MTKGVVAMYPFQPVVVMIRIPLDCDTMEAKTTKSKSFCIKKWGVTI